MCARFVLLLVAMAASMAHVGHSATKSPEEPRFQGRRLGSWLLAMPDFPECGPSNCRPFVALGTNAVPYLAWVVGRTNIDARDTMSLLRTMHARRTLEPSEEMLRSVQAKAAFVLEQLGSAARPATPALLMALRQGAGNQRLAAALALGAIAPRRPEASSLLENVLTTSPTGAPSAIAGIGSDAEIISALAGLAVVPRAGSWEKAAATVALCQASEDRGQTTRVLARLWAKQDRGFRLNVLPLLTRRLGADAFTVLREARTDRDPGVRRNAAVLQGELYEASPQEVVEALLWAADDESASVRFAALQTLWRIHPDSDAAVDASLDALDDTDPGIRGTATSRLSRYTGPRIEEVRRRMDGKPK